MTTRPLFFLKPDLLIFSCNFFVTTTSKYTTEFKFASIPNEAIIIIKNPSPDINFWKCEM